jgi:hypothetical protein
MTTPSPDPTDQQQPTKQEILERRDAEGRPIYDHVKRDEAGQRIARRHDDHNQWDRV